MFNGLQITDAGIQILLALIGGHTIQFSSIKLGDGNEPADFTEANDLTNTKQSLPVVRYKMVGLDTILAGANLYGNAITEGFYWKEIGLFARDITTGSPEVMFSYDNAGESASYMPAGGTVTEMLIDLMIKVNNAENVQITLDDSLIYATKSDLDETENSIINDLTAVITTEISEVNTTINNHIENEENPHGVTKTQVGLGSVGNYGMASTAEAQAGTSTVKYMNPKNVKDAVIAYSVISDGNTVLKVGGTQPSPVAGKTIIWIEPTS